MKYGSRLFYASPRRFSLLEKNQQYYHTKKNKGVIEIIATTPYQGVGKPEQLKHNLSGCWSRRINQEHRLVYMIRGDLVTILSMKNHY